MTSPSLCFVLGCSDDPRHKPLSVVVTVTLVTLIRPPIAAKNIRWVAVNQPYAGGQRISF